MKRFIIAAYAAIACAAVAGSAAAAEENSYGNQMVKVYNAYQAIRAHKDACDEALPNSRGITEKSYGGWRTRHAKLIAELDDRLAQMIRGVSKDDKEYARNIGKIEGMLLKQRQDTKQALLAQPRQELNELCKSLPELLVSKESDLETLYADELKSIRSRR